MSHNPQFSGSFQRYMSAFDEGRANWMDFYPVQERIGHGAREDKDAVLFVDIGGGMGHEAAALHKQFPELPGRYILQDLPAVVSGNQTKGVAAMAHDFLEPQPIKGKRIWRSAYCFHKSNFGILMTSISQVPVFIIFATSYTIGVTKNASRSSIQFVMSWSGITASCSSTSGSCLLKVRRPS